MKHAKKVFKFLVKGLALLIIIPALVHGVLLFVHSMARGVSMYSCIEQLDEFTSIYLKKHGNRYVALDMVYFYRVEFDGRDCESSSQRAVLYDLYKKYPDMREQYLAALVDGIMNIKTKPFNRGMLLWHLKELTGINFEGIPEGVRYEDTGPSEYTGVAEVEKWWEEHNREKLLKVQEIMKADPYYSGKPEENKEGNDDAP